MAIGHQWLYPAPLSFGLSIVNYTDPVGFHFAAPLEFRFYRQRTQNVASGKFFDSVAVEYIAKL